MITTEKKCCNNEIKEVAYSLFICNWIFGIGILEYPRGQAHRMISGFYVATILIVYCCLTVYLCPHIFEFSQQIQANDSIAKVFIGFSVFLIIITLLIGWSRNEKMHSVLERGIVADNFLREIEMNEERQKMSKSLVRKVVLQVFLIFMAVSIVDFFYFYKKRLSTRSIIALIIHNYPLIVLSIVDATFINLVQYSASKFNKLNNILENTLASTCDRQQPSNLLKNYENAINQQDESLKSIVLSDRVYIIITARKAHLNFIIFCEMINEVYAIHLLISIMGAIFMLTMSFYHSYCVLTSETISKVLGYQHILSMMSTIIIYESVKIHLFTKYCSDTIQGTVTTGDIISKMYNETINEEIKNELRNFEIQLIQHPLKFHVCNSVALDYTLTRKVIAKVTTSLVILTQCGKVTLRLSE